MRDGSISLDDRATGAYAKRSGVDHAGVSAALDGRRDYWNDYYSRGPRRSPPSQFAAFIASEFGEHDLVVDVGCGNGRDTVFFAQLGFATIGIDGSEAAIAHCRSLIEGSDRALERNAFMQRNVLDLRDDQALIDRITPARKIIYSRFFLHAIDLDEEQAFFDFAFSAIRPGDAVAVEFRSSLDKDRTKVTAAHYRRYIDVQALIDSVCARHGARLDYLAEGTGFAKYKADDAHVCRLVFSGAT